MKLKRKLDIYDQKLHDYLIMIAQNDIDSESSKRLSHHLDAIKNLERIGDHLTNIIGFFAFRYEKNMRLSQAGTAELNQMYDTLEAMMADTIVALEAHDVIAANRIIEKENRIDQLEKEFRYRYFERLKKKEVSVENYADILANMERIGDHMHNIASAVIQPLYVPQQAIIPKVNDIEKMR